MQKLDAGMSTVLEEPDHESD